MSQRNIPAIQALHTSEKRMAVWECLDPILFAGVRWSVQIAASELVGRLRCFP